MAFEGLTDKLQNAFRKLSSKGKLTEADVKTAMRDVRMALLEADVNYLVVKDFVKKVTERAVGADILESLTPGQQVIKIVNEELTELMGGQNAKLDIFAAGADDLYALWTSGRGQNHDGGQARQYDQEERQKAAFGRVRRVPSGGNQAAAGGRRSQVRGRGVRAADTGEPVKICEGGGPPTQRYYGRRSGDHRHGRPPAHRRGADGGAARRARDAVHPHGHPAGGRRDDRPGRGQRSRKTFDDKLGRGPA